MAVSLYPLIVLHVATIILILMCCEQISQLIMKRDASVLCKPTEELVVER